MRPLYSQRPLSLHLPHPTATQNVQFLKYHRPGHSILAKPHPEVALSSRMPIGWKPPASKGRIWAEPEVLPTSIPRGPGSQKEHTKYLCPVARLLPRKLK